MGIGYFLALILCENEREVHAIYIGYIWNEWGEEEFEGGEKESFLPETLSHVVINKWSTLIMKVLFFWAVQEGKSPNCLDSFHTPISNEI